MLYFVLFFVLFDPTKFYDSEKYIEKLVKMGKLLKKNSEKEKKDLKKII